MAVSTLPSGTVTFVFTDVEGSTRLLRALGEGWDGVLSEYRRILRETFAADEGREVDTQGDGMFFVFSRARPAVAAAAEAQRRLEEHEWPNGAAVRARMGIHTGEPAVGTEGYVGLDVVRAARIAAAAHGGQVLLSGTTQALLAREPVEGAGTIFLGEFRLKDIPGEEPLHQLVVAGLQTRFEAPRSALGSSAEAVPIAGRESEVARELEDVVRNLRTSIEQRVADSLRLESGFPLGLGRPPEPKRTPIWPFAIGFPVGLLLVVVAILWLLLR